MVWGKPPLFARLGRGLAGEENCCPALGMLLVAAEDFTSKFSRDTWGRLSFESGTAGVIPGCAGCLVVLLIL